MPIIQGILYGAAQRGARLSELCQAIGIAPEDLGDSETKVPFEQSCQTWEHAVRLTGDNLLGLHLGETSTASVLGMVGNLMQSSPDLLSAFEELTHFISVATDMVHFGVKKKGDEVTLTYKPALLWVRTYPVGARHSMEQSMSGTLHVFSLMAATKTRPLRATFSHKRAGDLAEYQRVFGDHLQFNASANQLVFAKSDLLKPVISHDRSLFTIFQRMLREKKSNKHQTRSDQIRQLVRTDFQGQIPSLEVIADRMNMVPRTLQRRLSDEGTTFRLLLAGLQKELATELLKSNGSVSQVANLLGYSDPSAFRRAFKKWDGG
ncbi:MAG TPA: AraC family transcriptional regulator [Cyclobacteriaceae bacterium]|nr:AraC family transcriptional regulator [Cyclobacteriaceae bacterium]